jgi:hypothetical protein
MLTKAHAFRVKPDTLLLADTAPYKITARGIAAGNCIHDMVGLYSKGGTRNRFAPHFGRAK